MNRLSADSRAAMIRCLIEGASVRSTARMAGTDKKTVLRLLLEVGDLCMEYQDTAFRNLKCRRIHVDECWQFIYAKQKNVTPEIAARQIAGDTWLWCAIDADTKLVPAWTVGPRDLLLRTTS